MNIAIITGGSSGVGRSAALALGQRKDGVIVTYNSRAAEADALVAEITNGGGSAAALQLDVSNIGGLDAFVEHVRRLLRERWQRDDFDTLVNNAGVGGAMPFGEVTESYYDAMFATNFKGPFFLTQKLAPLLRDGGHILNVSSGSARAITSVGFSVYGATKAALTTVTRYWAKELAPRRIRVNCISPGPIVTNFADGAFAKHPEYIAPLAASTLLGRIAQPDDIGAAIAALLSESCHFITAADIDVSGGFMV